MGARMRADKLLVMRGLAETETLAQALILAGRVWLGSGRVRTAGELLASDAEPRLQTPESPYASRGGLKLAGALAHFAIRVSGKVCLDVGASTGGFTDCLLQHGASHVLALDVGRGQLDWRLIQDPRVTRLEGINARYLVAGDLPQSPSLIAVDVSFISLRTVLPPLLAAVSEGSAGEALELLCLIKPQFELPRKRVGKGGLVGDPSLRRQSVLPVITLLGTLGWVVQGEIESPLPGAEGNIEHFVYACRDPLENENS